MGIGRGTMESLVNSFKGKKVLITGHTGFKGSWLAMWLFMMGAEVVGYSLEPNTRPSHYELLQLPSIMRSIMGDVRDFRQLYTVIAVERPDIVFHLAAEPLVRDAIDNPRNTFSTNMMGTVNILDACRLIYPVPQAIIIVTSDKTYLNKEWHWGYRETDELGGKDPYGASKGCADIITASFRDTFYDGKTVASVRAGNVIGGGDWSKHRLLPDIMKAKFTRERINIHNPDHTRPWQHVLDCVYGYLILAHRICSGEDDKAKAWNFGPSYSKPCTVREILGMTGGKTSNISVSEKANSKENRLLRLDSSMANSELSWDCFYNTGEAVDITTKWYKNYYENGDIITAEQIKDYVTLRSFE